jgi:transposase-like protein
MQAQVEQHPALDEIPRAQRRPLTQALPDFEKRYARNEAIARAYLSGQHTMAAIARHFGVHYTTVSRLVGVYEDSVKG